MTDQSPIRAYQISPVGIPKVFEDAYQGPSGDLNPFILKMSGNFFPTALATKTIDPAGANDYVAGISCDGTGIAMLVSLNAGGAQVVYMPNGPDDSNPYSYTIPACAGVLDKDLTRRHIVLYDGIIYVLAQWDGSVGPGWQALAISPTSENDVWTGQSVDVYQEDNIVITTHAPRSIDAGDILGTDRVVIGGTSAMTSTADTPLILLLASDLSVSNLHTEGSPSWDVNDIRLWKHANGHDYLCVAHSNLGAWYTASIFHFLTSGSFPSRVPLEGDTDTGTVYGSSIEVTPQRVLLGLSPGSQLSHLRSYRPVLKLGGIPDTFELLGDSYTDASAQRDAKRVVWSGDDMIFVLTGVDDPALLIAYSLQDLEHKALGSSAVAARWNTIDIPSGGLVDIDTNGPYLFVAGAHSSNPKVLTHQVRPATRLLVRHDAPYPSSRKWVKTWDW